MKWGHVTLGCFLVTVMAAGAALAQCSSNDECATGEFCSTPPGNCDAKGVCAIMPTECPRDYAPVCGCDGRTYVNECFAAMIGVSVDYDGECQEPGCLGNLECPDPTTYCEKYVGDCEGIGQCVERPVQCEPIYDPVCGCDGKTYANACFAQMAGVNVDYAGPCQQSGCLSNDDCPDLSTYCAKDPCDCDGIGACEPKPEACIALWDPVCGCDGRTYSNECYAAMAGVNVEYMGPCVGPCGSNADCAGDEYCQKGSGDCEGLGECTERPGACPDVWMPVCGCDGMTYGNACYAAMAGVNVDHAGVCESPCYENGACGQDEYCAKDPCNCEGAGMCTLRPEACPEVWDPVCGCDGNTYANLCYAAMAGVNVDYEGVCEFVCYDNDACGQDEYCQKDPCDCDGPGECSHRPEICPDVWMPVCGCDGMTYGNACEAAMAGVNVAYEGECTVASCVDNDECDPADYCRKVDGDCEGTGQCAPRPDVCIAVWDPVCGCDGQTYSNACYAAMAGVNVDYDGACAAPCGSNDDCPVDDYCQKDPCDCDGLGECAERPGACPDVWMPVCGCDGITYGNACYAAMAGVNVDYEGVCTTLMPCTENADCVTGDYCAKDPCDCDGYGVCEPRPEACPFVCEPVCGCDGVTYANACNAAKAGENVAHDGFCGPLPGDCNNDGVVDAADLNCMSENWLQTNCYAPLWCDESDMNYSTNVDVLDFGILAMHWLMEE